MENPNKIKILERALERQKAARIEAEKILEQKSLELYNISEELKVSNLKLQELLIQRTSELEGVFVNIIDAYIVMDLDGNVLKLNKAATKMLGYNINKKPLNLLSLVKKEYLEYTLKAFKELYNKGYYTNFRIVLTTKNGEEKLVQVNSSIIYNNEGKPIAAQGILRDITKEEQDKELIEEQKNQLDIIIDHSPIGIALSNKDDNGLILVNEALCNMLGYSNEELKSKKIMELTHHDEREESSKRLEQLYNGEIDTYTLNKKYLKKNGKNVWARTSVTAVKNSHHKIIYHVTTIEDISKEKKLELQKEELLKNLESQNEQLNEYAHIVSHDLKSPLRSISALLTWTKEDLATKLNEENMINLNLMEDKVEKMDQLISDILNYSSVQNDGINLELIDINQLIENTIEILLVPNHIKIINNCYIPSFKADAVRLQQVFQNLISNSINYMDKEQGLIEIDCIEKGNKHLFSVKDNGPGISKDYHQKIFEVFNSIGNHKNSTGIGLSIVKKVVELHKGKIWVESEPGEGTTFFFSIKK
ncbi:PAS domain S-box protein [Lutibacter sp. TH_r2]|uniref:PAS domain-containing sensor histidine kinase n=1 Tax=Lutibacter sp. TH_r2 TaxID=3082083 RepID=UPI002952FBA2|nr:PAS domain S-box protein [Lutibacter sp. TH_r2]MDV7186830.1 PAS domain S-box protein [Lutibacter sp. TH_r2]